MSDKPIPMLMWCPECSERHIDVGPFATKIHHTHSCQHCGVTWRPAVVATVGVQFLPGFKDDHPCESCGRKDGTHHVDCKSPWNEAHVVHKHPADALAYALKMLRVVNFVCPMGKLLRTDVVEVLKANGVEDTEAEIDLARQAYGEKGQNDGTE